MSKIKPRFTPKLNADIELKQLGTIMGNPIYVDLSGEKLDEDKFQRFLVTQKMLADFFNPPKKEDSNEDNYHDKLMKLDLKKVAKMQKLATQPKDIKEDK